MSNPLDVIVGVRAWLDDPSHWCRMSYGGRWLNGIACVEDDLQKADYTCLVGGIMRILGIPFGVSMGPDTDYPEECKVYFATVRILDQYVIEYTGGEFAEAMTFNDGHGHNAVLALLDTVIEREVNASLDTQVIPAMAIEPIEAIA